MVFEWLVFVLGLIVLLVFVRLVVSWLVSRGSQKAMSIQEIVMAVAKDPQSLTPELHERFWSLAARSNTGAETLVDQIAQSHLPYYKYLCIYYGMH